MYKCTSEPKKSQHSAAVHQLRVAQPVVEADQDDGTGVEAEARAAAMNGGAVAAVADLGAMGTVDWTAGWTAYPQPAQ